MAVVSRGNSDKEVQSSPEESPQDMSRSKNPNLVIQVQNFDEATDSTLRRVTEMPESPFKESEQKKNKREDLVFLTPDDARLRIGTQNKNFEDDRRVIRVVRESSAEIDSIPKKRPRVSDTRDSKDPRESVENFDITINQENNSENQVLEHPEEQASQIVVPVLGISEDLSAKELPTVPATVADMSREGQETAEIRSPKEEHKEVLPDKKEEKFEFKEDQNRSC